MRGQSLMYVMLVVILGACVSNKKVQYLQNDDVNKKQNELPKDSIVRNHELSIREYRIQPLDLLYIKVESLTPGDFDFITKMDPVPESTTTGGGATFAIRYGYLVDTNGELEYPVIGKVKVSGLTIFETQVLLAKLFAPHLTLPSVRVRLLNFRFTILGEVNVEQQVVISTNTRVTITEAIGLAGGLTDLADRSNIKIVRQLGSSTQVVYINLLEEKLIESPYYYIQQNDVIIAPPLKQRPFRKYFNLNLALVLSSLTTLLLVVTLTQK